MFDDTSDSCPPRDPRLLLSFLVGGRPPCGQTGNIRRCTGIDGVSNSLLIITATGRRRPANGTCKSIFPFLDNSVETMHWIREGQGSP